MSGPVGHALGMLVGLRRATSALWVRIMATRIPTSTMTVRATMPMIWLSRDRAGKNLSARRAAPLRMRWRKVYARSHQTSATLLPEEFEMPAPPLATISMEGSTTRKHAPPIGRFSAVISPPMRRTMS